MGGEKGGGEGAGGGGLYPPGRSPSLFVFFFFFCVGGGGGGGGGIDETMRGEEGPVEGVYNPLSMHLFCLIQPHSHQLYSTCQFNQHIFYQPSS